MKEETKVLVVLCFAEFLSTLIYFNYSAVLPLISKEWGLDGSMNGRLIGSFQAGYVVAVIMMGFLSDKIGGKRTFVICAIETGVCGVGFALFAHDYSSGLVWRSLAGLGQGGLYVPGMRVLSQWYPANERGKALGIYTSVLVAAYAGAYYIAGPIGAKYSWRLAILLTSVTAFPGAFLALLLVKDRPGRAVESGHRVTHPGASWRESIGFVRTVLFSRSWLLVTGAYMGHNWELFAMYAWIGAYLTASAGAQGMPVAQAAYVGSFTSATCILMGVFSTTIGGLLSDRLGRGKVILLFLAISICCSFAYGWLYGLSLVVLGIVGLIYGFAVVADSAIYKAAITDFIPQEALGAALGMQSFLGFGISAISPWVFGLVLDCCGWGWAWVSIGLGALLGPACIVIFQRLPEGAKQSPSWCLRGPG